MRLVWNDSLVTGIHQIDVQHQALIGIINDLQDAHEANCDQAALARALAQLTNYVKFHFGAEEDLMRTLSPLPTTHLQEHQAFIKILEGFCRGQDLSSSLQVGRLIEFLCHWLINHIMKTDMELAGQLLQGIHVIGGGSD